MLRGRYLGSAWRGAFGHALRKTVCVTRLPTCDPCVLLRSCPYPFLFESRTPPGARKLSRYPRTPGPYVLEPADRRSDSPADSLNLGVTLFGRANEQLPYVLHALEQAGRRGLTSKRVAMELQDVQAETATHDSGATDVGRGTRDDAGDRAETTGHDSGAIDRRGWTTVFTPEKGLDAFAAVHPEAPPVPSRIRVRLLSPLRVRRREHLVGAADFDFHAFASGLLRRISLLTYFFGDMPLEVDFASLLNRAKSIPLANRELRWQAWTRYSSRQKTKLNMDGVVGGFELDGAELEAFWPCLWLGQWTHAGKGTSMGLGRYALEAVGGDRRGAADGTPDGAALAGPVPL